VPPSFVSRNGLIVLASVCSVTPSILAALRVDHGPGYRVYFVQRGDKVVILLSGGDKGSQDRDIKRAIEMAKEV
jgi:putative addiction module killer protein